MFPKGGETITWKLKTLLCTFEIRQHKKDFALYVDDEMLQTAPDPGSLADNVFTHTSEYFPWDVSDYEVEDSLSEWTCFK